MLNQCKQLKVLFLCDCISSDRFALYVIVHCPNIVAFNCVRCCLESRRSIGQMFALHRHRADFSKMHSNSLTSGLMDIQVLRHSLWSNSSSSGGLQRLELNLWDAEKTIFQEVVSQCPQLTSLVVSGCCKSGDTADGIRDLVKGLPCLTYLRLQGMSISLVVIAAIAGYGSRLQELHLMGQVEQNVRLHTIGQYCPLLRSLSLATVRSPHIDCDLVYILFHAADVARPLQVECF